MKIFKQLFFLTLLLLFLCNCSKTTNGNIVTAPSSTAKELEGNWRRYFLEGEMPTDSMMQHDVYVTAEYFTFKADLTYERLYYVNCFRFPSLCAPYAETGTYTKITSDTLQLTRSVLNTRTVWKIEKNSDSTMIWTCDEEVSRVARYVIQR